MSADLITVLDTRLAKSFRLGTHRAVAPAETLARIRSLAARMGITRVANVTGLDCIGIPVAMAVRPNARSVSVSQGKGIEVSHAMASALMEAAETFHGEDLEPRLRFAAAQDLARAGRILDPFVLNRTEAPFDARTVIAWIEGYDFLARAPVCVPAETVHTDCTIPGLPGSGFFIGGSNGLASGNHLLEAISAGLCEVVERDAVALWNARSLNARARLTLDLSSVDDEPCRALLDSYAKAGVVVRVWNATPDFGIATFVCDLPAASGGVRFRGSGCHPDRGVALARALTEAAQNRLHYIVGARDTIEDREYAASTEARVGAALLDALSGAAPPLAFAAVPDFRSDDVGADVAWMLDRLAACGVAHVAVVNLTRPELGIAVVRVVIPGLEWDCNHPNYRPGIRARNAAVAS